MANLITLEEYKLSQGLKKPDDDARLETLISSISQLVKTHCANSFVDYYTTAKTELITLNIATNFIQLTESPIVAITSVEERINYASDYVLLTTAAQEYYLDDATDSILRTTVAGYRNWPIGPGAVRVIYKAGYADIPMDLKLACFDLVKYYFKEEYKPTKSLMSASITNETTSSQWRNVGFPDHIKRVLDYYKQVIA